MLRESLAIEEGQPLHLPKLLCLTHCSDSPESLELFLNLSRPVLQINSNTSYELKTILQTEYDGRGMAMGKFIKSTQSILAWRAAKRIKVHPPQGTEENEGSHQTTTAIFELKTGWIGVNG